jgi:CRP-like cAMP-binding protein
MEDIGLLKKIFFLKDLSSQELRRINMLVERSVFKKGEEIMREGAECDALYIIKRGSVDVSKAGIHVESLGREEPIGEISFIDKGSRSATLVAAEDCELIKIPAESFEKLMSREKELANKIYKSITITLCRRLREANEALK